MRWFLFGLGLLAGLANSFAATPRESEERKVALSDEQRQWIAAHPHVRVGITPDWAPFSFFQKNGKPTGIDIEILDIISQRTGIHFEIVTTDSWDQTLSLAREKMVDFTTSTSQTSEREKLFQFTRPYFEAPVVIVSRDKDLRFYQTSRLRDAVVAMPKYHVTTTELLKQLPSLRINEADTLLDCFKLVAEKKADATVANMITTSRYLNDYPALNLIISGVTEFRFPLRLAVRREAPVLTSILDQALGSISPEELDEITSRYLPFGLEAARRGAVWHRRWMELVIIGLILGALLLWWNRSISDEVHARRAAEAKLQDINKSLEVFSFSISHDLRAPLRSIRGFSLALLEDYSEKLDATGTDYLHRLSAAAQRMENLIDDVLAYSQASRSELPIQPIALQEMIPRLIDEFPEEQRKRFHVAPELPEVMGNPTLLSQTITNLLSNAVKFAPENREPKVVIRADKNENFVRLWVEDNGIGIASEDKERIFKIFERVNGRREGSGIGLAVVAKAVEKMGGRAGVESELEKGSRFWIELPTPDNKNRKPRLARPTLDHPK